jgi:hypothetical protein
MREMTKEEAERLWMEVREEFPRDELMQEIHFVRMKMQLEMDDMTPEERIRYINSVAHEGRSG